MRECENGLRFIKIVSLSLSMMTTRCGMGDVVNR